MHARRFPVIVIGLAVLVGLGPSVSAGTLQGARKALEGLEQTIMLRTDPAGEVYGKGELDPLIWPETDFPLFGESQTRLLAALREVEKLSEKNLRQCPPEQRALAQNRVWAVFDHVFQYATDFEEETSAKAARKLEEALVRVMAKLALDDKDIDALADPLVLAVASKKWPTEPHELGGPDAFLPSEILSENRGWETLVKRTGEATGIFHVPAFGGRSVFLVRVRFPEGAPSAKAYFTAVGTYPRPWIEREGAEPPDNLQLNPELPLLPVGTQVALIRRLAVIDRKGHWRSTRLTVGVQLRNYRVTAWDSWKKLTVAERKRVQSFAEFQLETEKIAAGKIGELRALAYDEKHYNHFFSHTGDFASGGLSERDRKAHVQVFSKPTDVTLLTCIICHSGVGLGSINSLTFARSPPFSLNTITTYPEAEATDLSNTAYWKTTRVEWGFLQALWPR